MRLAPLGGLFLVAVTALGFLGPIQQYPAFHAFADTRSCPGVLVRYALALGFKHTDHLIFALTGGTFSGHSAKHLIAAHSPLIVVHVLSTTKLDEIAAKATKPSFT